MRNHHPHVPRAKKKKYNVQPGSAPGIFAVEPGGPQAEITVMGYDLDRFEERKIKDFEEIAAMKAAWSVVWVHVAGLGDNAALNALQKVFGLHNLALEDVVDQNQRPKMEVYDDHGYMVLISAERQNALNTSQVNLFLGEGFIVTVVESPCPWEEPIRRRIRAQGTKLRSSGSSYLAYAVIDSVIDLYFPMLDRIVESVESIEGLSMQSPGKSEILRLHHISGELLALRRILTPMKDMLSNLLIGENALIQRDVRIYFRDCIDHTAQLLDEIDMEREISRSLVDTTLSAISNRMNEIMKVLTVISTIFIPLSFMVGLWGMNFDPDVSPMNMPELRWKYGYPAALLLMLAVSIGLLFYFHRKGWLGGDRDKGS